MPRKRTTLAEGDEVGRTPEGSRGPSLPLDWQERFIKALEETGGYFRAARKVGVGATTVQKYRDMYPEFDKRCREAREYHADVLEEKMEEQAEEYGNPVGYIVRLKALRPNDYIEKHAIARLNFNIEGTVDEGVAMEFLKRMLASSTDATRAVLDGQPLPLALPANDTAFSLGAPDTPPVEG